MGTHEPIREGEFEKCAQMYQDSIANDPSSIWLAVRDCVSGKIVGGCNWKLYVNAAEKGTDRETKRPSWLEGEDLEFSNMICGDSSQARREAMPGPHAYLHICFTDAAYRRRGAGSMMLQWGVDVADLLHIPAYIEASKDGNFLYKTFGFYDYSVLGDPNDNDGAVTMKRDVRTSFITGGKPAPGN